ncbi:Peptidase M20 [Candidatus Promineifilum breve]|uniref:Peptidase M20 n=1 Tax=Candidatus Promineifilum breve TaxID=1806508 RepID=A0A160T5J3_9CHLR|nr:M20/M25/M40 family metallo-hydrolase [Candidatus Promineifilum breve]CUS05526.2 Peptidase M20 [Candidatus Promineifilum breve]
MNLIDDIAQRPEVAAACASFHARLETILDQIVAIQQIPAPTSDEGQRARYVEERFRALGLADVRRDGLNNVYGRAPGSDAARRPLVLTAHLDTVFPTDTDLAVRRDGALYHGPGIGDNSTGVAGLLVVAEALREQRIPHAADIHFVANVGEEGLGDLRGMRAVVDHFGGAATYVVVEGGLYGQLTHQAIGVRRYRVEVTAPGGHSWGSFGAASAIHVLGRLIAAIDGLNVPVEPKTTYNVGIIEGGLSINTIAAAARLWLDLRSESPEALNRLVGQVHDIAREMSDQYAARGEGVGIDLIEVGNRPAGHIPRRSPIVAAADAALRAVGCAEVRYIVSSTDANIPLSRGYQAVCLGLTHSTNCHRTDEYIDVTHLPAGLGQLLLVTLAAAG